MRATVLVAAQALGNGEAITTLSQPFRVCGEKLGSTWGRMGASGPEEGGPVNVFGYVVLAFAPAAVFIGAAKALEWWVRWGGPRNRTPMPTGPPIERLVGDLRRLERDYVRIEESDLPRRASRLQSVSLAYDDTLFACCTALEIPCSGRPPLDAVQRLEVEAALAQRGLTW
jgi:hypothetical protein